MLYLKGYHLTQMQTSSQYPKKVLENKRIKIAGVHRLKQTIVQPKMS